MVKAVGVGGFSSVSFLAFYFPVYVPCGDKKHKYGMRARCGSGSQPTRDCQVIG